MTAQTPTRVDAYWRVGRANAVHTPPGGLGGRGIDDAPTGAVLQGADPEVAGALREYAAFFEEFEDKRGAAA